MEKVIDNNKYGFIDRLEKLRTELGFNKADLSKYLDVDLSLVSLIYSNKRTVTDNLLNKLVDKTEKEELYWRFGIEPKYEYIKLAEELKESIKVISDFREEILDKELSDKCRNTIYKIIGKAIEADLKFNNKE